MSTAGRGATQDYSRGNSTRRPGRPTAWPWTLAGLAGGLALVAADLSTLYQVRVVTVTKASITGHAQHGYALLVIGLAALALALLFGGRRASGARFATGLLGLLALAIVLLGGDFHDAHSTGSIGALYENARAAPGRGFYLESFGGVLLTACGFGGLLARGAGRAPVGRSASAGREHGPDPAVPVATGTGTGTGRDKDPQIDIRRADPTARPSYSFKNPYQR